jgi:hypothetical protein
MENSDQTLNNSDPTIEQAAPSQSFAVFPTEPNSLVSREYNEENYSKPQHQNNQEYRRITLNTHLIDIKLKGLTNGVLEIPQNYFEEWIIRDNDLTYINDKLEDKKDKLKLVNDKIRYILTTKEQKKVRWQEAKSHVAEAKMKCENANEKVSQIKKTVKSLEEEIEQYQRPYLLIMGLVFLLGCIVMILTDIEILDKIFDALGVPKGEGFLSNPRLIMQIGFASAMLAIKPSMDFVIDNYRFKEPNEVESNKTLRNRTYLVIAFLILTCLSFMSWHRSLIDENGVVTRSPFEAIQIAIFLSGPAFALGGTLLLNLAHRNFKISWLKFIKKWRLNKLIKQKLVPIEQDLETYVSDRLKKEAIFLSLDGDLVDDEDLQKLYADSSILNSEIEELKEKINNVLNEKEIAIYRDAIEVGKKYELQGKLMISPSELHEYIDSNETSTSQESKRGTFNGPKIKNSPRPRRPYVMLRKLIAKNTFKSNSEQIDVSDN